MKRRGMKIAAVVCGALIILVFAFCGYRYYELNQQAYQANTETVLDWAETNLSNSRKTTDALYLLNCNTEQSASSNTELYLLDINQSSDNERKNSEYQAYQEYLQELERQKEAQREAERKAAQRNNSSGTSSGDSGSSGSSGTSTSTQSSGIISAEAGASSSVFNQAVSVWNNQVPSNIKNLLVNNGWRIVISASNLSSRFGYSYSIAGLTVFGEKTIYFDNRSSVINRSMVHEIGHAVDAIYGYPSSSSEFASLMAQETIYPADGDNRGATNSMECFANTFQYIIQYGSKYESYSPNIYAFVRQYM